VLKHNAIENIIYCLYIGGELTIILYLRITKERIASASKKRWLRNDMGGFDKGEQDKIASASRKRWLRNDIGGIHCSPSGTEHIET
jgi:hypothetical protein